MQTHLKCLWNESQFIRKSEEYWYCSNKLRAVRSTDWQSELFHSTKSTSFVRRSSLNWHRHGQGENNEKTDTVDTISIHSTNTASSILMQWSHEMMFAIVIFKICRQLLGALHSDPHWGSTPGPHWGASIWNHDRGDIPTFTPAEASTLFSDPVEMQGWVDLGTAVKVCSPCPRLHIAVAVTINTAVCGEIQTWILSHCSRPCVMKNKLQLFLTASVQTNK